jgi:hypothetical protein
VTGSYAAFLGLRYDRTRSRLDVVVAERDAARDIAVRLEQQIAEALAMHPDCPHRMPCCDMALALRGDLDA